MDPTAPHRDLVGIEACLIVDGPTIEGFAYTALQRAQQRGLRITSVVVCENTVFRRRRLAHGAYYLFRLLAGRSASARGRVWAPLAEPDVAVHRFNSEWEGSWQRLPQDTLRFIGEQQVDVVLRFGMTLMRDPDEVPARYGVLSFHHGDPSQYRGRPAGFYEVLDGAEHVGAMVQRLSNELDAGTVLAYGQARVDPCSYRRTLEAAYRLSPFLLTTALRNLRAGRSVPRATEGRNCRLPGNVTMLRFVRLLVARNLSRLRYGLTMQKAWHLSQVADVDLSAVSAATRLEAVRDIETPPELVFLADPAVVDEHHVLCEGLDRRTGTGQLVSIHEMEHHYLDTSKLGRGHLSYPRIYEIDGERWVLPEMAQIGAQKLGRLSPDLARVVDTHPLVGLERRRLIDPTLLLHEGRWWLFAGEPDTSSHVLRLWSAPHPTARFLQHPESPIVLDPARARMAGPIQEHRGRLYRLGQDNRHRYGDGITVCEVTTLTEDHYEEHIRGRLRFSDRHGPHTLSTGAGQTIVDGYQEQYDVTAGLRRLRARAGRR